MKPVYDCMRGCVLMLFICGVMPVFAAPGTDAIEALMEQGQLGQALTAVDQGLSAQPDDVNLLFMKGLILTRQNELDKARDIFLEITKRFPELPEPYNNLAVIYAAQGDYNSARQALQQAINTHPSYATAHENMGDVYAKMASRAYNQALELDQDNDAARQKLALVNRLFPVENPQQLAELDANRAAADAVRSRLAQTEQDLQQARADAERERQKAEQLLAQLDKQQEESSRQLELVRQQRAGLEQRLSAAESGMDRMRGELEQLRQGQARAAAVAPAAAAQPAPGGAAAPDRAAVNRALDDWVRSWSEQDSSGYLSSYAPGFKPPGGISRRAWESQRRKRITAPRFIQVSISDRAVSFTAPDTARVEFIQDYKSDTYQDRVRKILTLVNQNNHWLILEEYSR